MNRFWTVIVLGFVAAIFWSGCNNEDDAYKQHRVDCVERINAFRATEGLPALNRWTNGESCADEEAKQDAGSSTPHGAFGQCEESAQNECPGWDSMEQIIDGCIQMMWNEGPGEPYSEHGHYINMTNPSYTKVACGFYQSKSNGVWSVQNFK